MAAALGFFEGSGAGGGEVRTGEEEEVHETGKTVSDWGPRAVELTAEGEGSRIDKQ